jgi:TPP-dependent pyruvate/acetoin dehydrogenase alpha subunit
MVAELMGQALGSCKGKGGSMHIADVDQGMLGANGIGTLAVPIGQIAAVSVGSGPVTIAGQSRQHNGDVTADIGGSATTDAVTGKISSAITSLAKA